MEKFKKILKTVLNVFIWIFVAFSVCVTVLVFAARSNSDGVPALFGKSVINVLTDSMSPAFDGGDIIICDMVTESDKSNIEIDKVITFYVDLDKDGKNEINSHRVVNRYEENGTVYYETWGDNREMCPGKDASPVMAKDVICVWSGAVIPGVGTVLQFLQTPNGFLLVIVLPLVVFFLYELYRFLFTFFTIKNEGKAKMTKEDEEEIKKKAIEEYLRSQEAQKAPQESEESDKN